MLARVCTRPGLVPSRTMSTSSADRKIYFGAFEVTRQVFLLTPYSFALVNIKPLLPGHVLVCPLMRHKRLTDLSVPELTDLMLTVQKVQRLLAHHYFRPEGKSPVDSAPAKHLIPGTRSYNPIPPEDGSFNIAIQDGAEAGQTVPHVHVHVIPRIRDVSAKDPTHEGDSLYERMADEEGNVGGALWDQAVGARPTTPGGKLPSIEDSQRMRRSQDDMEREVEVYKGVLKEMGW
ncbi:related to bis(5`-nucleosyl)-tetraphosphatase (asymmetrical) [Cephalotrichum gorgonifer]|uniref:Bis(5'-adenosyl)-triphosphatase n=1 Tax=Cephalotrichum gorgonifer TaxID=2041049 RepID=A0AAE8MVQ7_9PEZI|nr:related to bis(5`-nucleosyl)-tetraphosphatase (asymmetrical) [Cephalotrichum gorgonifer]